MTFVLVTEASRQGRPGAVLSQIDDANCERVVLYISRGLSSAERNYGISKLEYRLGVKATTLRTCSQSVNRSSRTAWPYQLISTYRNPRTKDHIPRRIQLRHTVQTRERNKNIKRMTKLSKRCIEQIMQRLSTAPVSNIQIIYTGFVTLSDRTTV